MWVFMRLTQYGQVVGSFERGNEASGSIKAIEFLDELLLASKGNPCSIWSVNAESVMYVISLDPKLHSFCKI